MHKINQRTLTALETDAYNAYLRGARTEEDYFSLGYSPEEIARFKPGVARKVREAEQAAA